MRQKLIPQLRRYIGQTVQHNGIDCTIVEVLEEPLSLILQATGPPTEIQQSQFGKPHRRVIPIFTLPCLCEEGGIALHPQLLALGLNLK